MRLVSRGAWGARPPRAVSPIGEVKGAAVHYTGMDADRVSDHEDCAARVRGVQRFHMDTRGWNDIAYSWLVCQHGYVFEGRGWGVRSAGQGTNDGNNHWYAVCFLGGDQVGRDDVTAAGREALGELLRRIPGEDHRPHSAFTGTSCPGDELRGWLEVGGWRVTRPWPVPVPAWFWEWAKWRLNNQSYPRPAVPRLIPLWAWLRLAALIRARRGT